MPWTENQMRVIRARAHGWKPRPGGPFENVSEEKAREMSHEGVKRTARDAHNALKARKRG
jgi:hypothetical protein